MQVSIRTVVVTVGVAILLLFQSKQSILHDLDVSVASHDIYTPCTTKETSSSSVRAVLPSTEVHVVDVTTDPLDPEIRLVPIQAFHPCDKKGVKRGTTLPLQVNCMSTIVAEDEIDDLSSIVSIDPAGLQALCGDFSSKGREQGLVMLCLQTPNTLGVFMRKSNNSYNPIYPAEGTNIMANLDKVANGNAMRMVERKTVVAGVGTYEPTSPAYDALRAKDSNFGNFLWSFGATRLLNPVTTNLISAAAYDKQLSSHAEGAPFASALLMATANALNIEDESLLHGLWGLFRQLSEKYEVPVVLMGLGVQAEFDFINDAIKSNANAVDLSKVIPSPPQDPNRRPLTGDVVNQAVIGKVPLFDHQKRSLLTLERYQSRPAIAVRGELTATICRNGGVRHCVSTGCPTLLISRALNLGSDIQKRWQRLMDVDLLSKKKLSIALALPAVNPNASGQLYSRLVDVLLRVASSSHDCVFNIQMDNDEPWLDQYIKKSPDPAIQALNGKLLFKKYENAEEWLADASQMDFILSTRIHGSMVGYSTGVPTVVIPTDHRIQELVDSMYLPHLTLEDLSELPTGGNSNSFLLEILKRARYSDFGYFEENRRDKIRLWHEILTATGLEMDPSLVVIARQ